MTIALAAENSRSETVENISNRLQKTATAVIRLRVEMIRLIPMQPYISRRLCKKARLSFVFPVAVKS